MVYRILCIDKQISKEGTMQSRILPTLIFNTSTRKRAITIVADSCWLKVQGVQLAISVHYRVKVLLYNCARDSSCQ